MPPRDLAQRGLALMEAGITELLAAYPKGLRNADIAEELGIRSDYKGSQKDYLSWSIFGIMLKDGRVTRTGRRYVLTSGNT